MEDGRKKGVENDDLWKKLYSLVNSKHKNNLIKWKYIPAHSGIIGNERADNIATSFADRNPNPLFKGAFINYPYIKNKTDILPKHVQIKKKSLSKFLLSTKNF